MYTNKQIWSVSYPILLSLLAQNVINVTDTAFLGHVSEVALGSIGYGRVILYMCIHHRIRIQYRFADCHSATQWRRPLFRCRPCHDSGSHVPVRDGTAVIWIHQGIRWKHHAFASFFRIHLRRNNGVSGLAYLRILFLFYQCHVPGIVHRHYTH